MDIPASACAFNTGKVNIQLSVLTDRPHVRLAIGGSLSLEQSYALQRYLTDLVESLNPGDTLVLDLQEVSYISSTGVGALSNTLMLTHRKNIPLHFRSIPPKVAGILELLGLLSFFPQEKSVG